MKNIFELIYTSCWRKIIISKISKRIAQFLDTKEIKKD